MSKYNNLEKTLEDKEQIETLTEEIMAVITDTYDFHILEDGKIENKVEKLATLVVKQSKIQDEVDQDEDDEETLEEDLEVFIGDLDDSE